MPMAANDREEIERRKTHLRLELGELNNVY